MDKKFKRTLVTCALPYANGPVHIGHLAGAYVPGDIYVRYLRLRGEDVVFICGSDEHGVPITIKAREQGVSPQDIVDKYHQIMKDAFTGLGINFDIYSRTTSKVHEQNAAEFFRKLYDDDKFITQESEQYYDVEAKTFLADRYIEGTCPKCGNPTAMNPGSGTGFSSSTRSGSPMCTASARAGWTAVCSPVPSAVTWTGASPSR